MTESDIQLPPFRTSLSQITSQYANQNLIVSVNIRGIIPDFLARHHTSCNHLATKRQPWISPFENEEKLRR